MRLDYDPDAIRLKVSDDGAGFDPARVNGGYGLRGMRTRVAEAGGTLTVRSAPGAGTHVSAIVPGVIAIRVLLADDHPVVRRACAACWPPSRTSRWSARPPSAPRR